MKPYQITELLIGAAFIYLVSLPIAAQDQPSVRVPNGLAFSEFKGYDAWSVIAGSQAGPDGCTNTPCMKAIVGNAAMIKAYQDGIPANGKAVPDGAMMAKIEWSLKSNPAPPYALTVPDTLKSVAFMVKDGRRFADSGGWGYAQFKYDVDSGTVTPVGTGSACGYTCHTRVMARDYVFTSYAQR